MTEQRELVNLTELAERTGRSTPTLRKLIKRNVEVEAHLEAAFSHNIRAKLVATNERLQTAIQANESETSAAE